MSQDIIARGMASRALKEIETLGSGEPLITSVNGQTGAVELSAHDIHAEKEHTFVSFNLGRVYSVMQPNQTADVSNMIDFGHFNTICKELYHNNKKIIMIDGMLATIYVTAQNSIECCMHESYITNNVASTSVYDISLYSTDDKVMLECISVETKYFGVQPNYAQSDPTSLEFIKNKPTFETKITNISQDSQGHTIITIDKTRQQIANAITLGKLVYINYDGKVMFYGENGGAGFHYRYLTANTIVAGEDNIATSIVDTSLLFASQGATENKLLLTTLIFEK